MTTSFEVVTEVAAPIEVVFDLARDVDAQVAPLAGSGERAVAGVTIGPGETVTWNAHHFGVPFTKTSRIGDFERGRFLRHEAEGRSHG